MIFMSKWEQIARHVKVVYGSFVDWDERFFICPDCGEPIYECDWASNYLSMCPICDFDWLEDA